MENTDSTRIIPAKGGYTGNAPPRDTISRRARKYRLDLINSPTPVSPQEPPKPDPTSLADHMSEGDHTIGERLPMEHTPTSMGAPSSTVPARHVLGRRPISKCIARVNPNIHVRPKPIIRSNVKKPVCKATLVMSDWSTIGGRLVRNNRGKPARICSTPATPVPVSGPKRVYDLTPVSIEPPTIPLVCKNPLDSYGRTKGIIWLGFGVEYDRLLVQTAGYSRRFTDLPFIVLTNLGSSVRDPRWGGIPGVTFKVIDIPDTENRAVRTTIIDYTDFDATLYLDSDSLIQRDGVDQFFEILGDNDVLLWRNRTHTASNTSPGYDVIVARNNFRYPLDVYAGGVMAFTRSLSVVDMFRRWCEYWRGCDRQADMPALAIAVKGSLINSGLKVSIISPASRLYDKGFDDDKGDIRCVVQHRYTKFWRDFGIKEHRASRPNATKTIYGNDVKYSRLKAGVAKPRGKVIPVFWQKIDDNVLDFVLANKKLQKISQKYKVVFTYNGVHEDEIQACYNNVVILKTTSDSYFDKAIETFDYLKGRDDYTVLVRTCCDSVIISPDRIIAIVAANQIDTPYIIGGRLSRQGSIRGGCVCISKSLVDAFKPIKGFTMRATPQYDAKYANYDSWFYRSCVKCGAKPIEVALFKCEDRYSGKYPVWHPLQKRSLAQKLFSFRHIADDRQIAVLVPSRGRQNFRERLCKSMLDTMVTGSVRLYLGIDSDDSTLADAISLETKYSFVSVIQMGGTGEYKNLGVLWNTLASKTSEPIISMIGDDMVFRTPGWDREILKEFDCAPADGFRLVYCHDGNKNLMAVNLFINRTYIDATGYFMREEFPVDGIDLWLNDVYKGLNRSVNRRDIIIEHMHWSFGKSTADDTTRRMNYRKNSLLSKNIYKGLAEERTAEIAMLEGVIKNAQKRNKL